jgi:hypothetical protein
VVVSYERIFVDGHSVLFAWDDLRKLHERSPQKAQNELIATLTGFQDAIHVPVTLVFDGGKRTKPSGKDAAPAGVELLYSDPGETADAVIERRVAECAKEAKMLVVTNDRVERITVESFGAETMSAENLADWIEREQRQFGRRMDDIHKQARRYQKFP